MHYVYILKSHKNNDFYTGCTQDLKERLKLHNSGKVFATQAYRPWSLIHYEAFINKKDAYIREKWLKTGWGRNQVRKMLANYLN